MSRAPEDHENIRPPSYWALEPEREILVFTGSVGPPIGITVGRCLDVEGVRAW